MHLLNHKATACAIHLTDDCSFVIGGICLHLASTAGNKSLICSKLWRLSIAGYIEIYFRLCHQMQILASPVYRQCLSCFHNKICPKSKVPAYVSRTETLCFFSYADNLDKFCFPKGIVPHAPSLLFLTVVCWTNPVLSKNL